MQEPHYQLPEIKKLLSRIGQAKIPCMSIINMPPPPFLKRIRSVDLSQVKNCYGDMSVWEHISEDLITNCSPDPQAFRPDCELPNILQVRLPTNFKCASFSNSAANEKLRLIERDIDATKIILPDGSYSDVPVKLRVSESMFTPLAKWPMLIAGNYRCILDARVQSIRDAVHHDLKTSEETYSWVCNLCRHLGSTDQDLVPFEKYANAALSLTTPSSPAQALAKGTPKIERADKLIQKIGANEGLIHPLVEIVVKRVDLWLERNQNVSA